jgi:8-oxo-dGTP pyrophosphatase MutT (NUDIX family)
VSTRARSETSAGGIVFRVENGQPLVLLIRDSYRNWGFPKGHLERDELPEAAALRETAEETGLTDLAVRQPVDTIEWHFRFRGKLIHKVCHFFLMETAQATTSPQQAEGITACRWFPFEEAYGMVSYANARDVLRRAHEMVSTSAPARA